MKNITSSKISLGAVGMLMLGLSWAAAVEDFERDSYRQEIYISDDGMSRDAASVSEQKQYEYQTAKSVTDMHGNRVRMEQYLTRPQGNQTRVYVYNSRDNRVDTGYALSTYNKELPADLAEVARQNKNNPAWYITDQTSHMENVLGDSSDRVLSGGKLYKTADTPDGGTYALLYDEDKFSINGKPKIDVLRQGQDASLNVQGYTEFWFPNAQGTLEKSFDSRFDITRPIATWQYVYNAGIFPKPLTHEPALADVISKLASGQPVDLHEKTSMTFADGTTLSIERAWVNDSGKIVTTADLKDAGQKQDWSTVSQWNTEIIVTASEWQGRDIDIMWSPQSFLSQIMTTSSSSLTE